MTSVVADLSAYGTSVTHGEAATIECLYDEFKI